METMSRVLLTQTLWLLSLGDRTMLGALLWGIGASSALAEENEKAKTKSAKEELEYAKVIIQDLLNNSDEYARQRAIDWLEEIEK